MAKNLGTLTLDLVAKIGGFVDGLSKAERETKKRMDGVSNAVNSAAKSLGALSLAAVASAAAVVSKTAASAKEIQNLSRVANTSAEDFQRITYASKQFGVEQDKVADIIKDVNDKIGDYLTTGAGPMADFFETVAPLVGVTAENFRDLSGPDALQLYVSSLEKANLSQAEMTFFMEAIASDATLLLPLLKNNGKELQNLGKQADQLGAVLSDLEIKQLQEVSKATDVLAGAFSGAANEVTIALLPAMQDMADLLQDPKTIESLSSIATGIGNIATTAVKAGTSLVDFTKYLAESLAAIRAGAAGDDIFRLEDQLALLRDMKNSGPLDRVRFFGKDGLVEYYNDAELDAEIAKITAQIKQAYEGLSVPPPTVSSPTGTKSSSPESSSGIVPITKAQREEQEKLNEQFQKTLDAYRQQIALGQEATELEKVRFEIVSGTLKGITADQQRQLEVNAELIDGYNDLIAAAEEATAAEQKRAEIKSQFQSLQDSLATEAELETQRYQQSLELLAEAEAAKVESIRPYQELREQLEQEHQDRLSKIANGGAMSRRDFEVMSFKDKAKTMAGLVAQFTQATATEDRKMFELNKVAATANAVISTYEGIAKAWSFGPILGPIFAAIVAAGGFAQVRGIQSQSFGGGSVAPSVAATGATSVVATTQAAQQITPQSSGRSVVVNISGPVTGLNEDILAERINELIDRDYINLRSA